MRRRTTSSGSAGALSGAPGGVPSSGPGDKPYDVRTDILSNARKEGTEPTGGPGNKIICRKCNTWRFCGNPIGNNKAAVCDKNIVTFNHQAYSDDDKLTADLLKALIHLNGLKRGPVLDTDRKK